MGTEFGEAPPLEEGSFHLNTMINTEVMIIHECRKRIDKIQRDCFSKNKKKGQK